MIIVNRKEYISILDFFSLEPEDQKKVIKLIWNLKNKKEENKN